MAQTKKIVVRLMPNHPTGKRNRAGFSFTTRPCEIEVSAKQEKDIIEDKYLRILTKGTAFAQGQSNPQSARTDAQKEADRKAEENFNKRKPYEELNIVQVIDELVKNGKEPGKDFDPENSTKAELIDLLLGQSFSQRDDANEEDYNNLTKAEIVKKLEEKGLEAKKDFDPKATNAALLELLTAE